MSMIVRPDLGYITSVWDGSPDIVGEIHLEALAAGSGLHIVQQGEAVPGGLPFAPLLHLAAPNSSKGGGAAVAFTNANLKHWHIGVGATEGLRIVESGVAETVRFSQVASGGGMYLLNGPFRLVDGITEPGTVAGFAQLYVDAADGDLKVKFGDGVVKTLATDV